MMYLAFAIFFAFNFSLWFTLPALILKAITKKGRKKKDKSIKNDYIVYGTLSGIYVLVYGMYFKYFYTVTDKINIDNGVGYITNELGNLALVLIFFMIISVLYVCFTFYLAKKLFRLNNFNKGYIVISLMGFFNILTYFFSNSLLNLSVYAFEADKYILNLIMKIDNEFLLFLFPLLVFANFASSFIEEK